jgi:chorismate synthase
LHPGSEKTKIFFMSSTWGTLFRTTTFGESHGLGVGCIVDGCPPGVPVSEKQIQRQLDRRRPGQSEWTSPREERDRVRIWSGVEAGETLGTPIGMQVENRDMRPQDYEAIRSLPRPSHADVTYQAKYGRMSASGGGRASARETVGRVAAGAVAEAYLQFVHGVRIVAWVSSVGEVDAPDLTGGDWTREQVDADPVRCPDPTTAARMRAVIAEARDAKDSVGGVVSCVCRGLPAGWGEPVFDKLEAILAQGMLSLPASKGFEIGSGFSGSRMRGSAHNDPILLREGRIATASNRSGGVQGGISNGEPIWFRVAFKPPATIGLPQQTVDAELHPAVLEAKGRHDPCVVPRAVPIVEAMAALALADAALRQAGRVGRGGGTP